MQPAGRHPRVQIDRVDRHGLEQVEDVQTQHELSPLVTVEPDVAPMPETVPGLGMRPGKRGEAGRVLRDRQRSRLLAIGDRPVPRREERDDLLDPDGPALQDLERQPLLDVRVRLGRVAFDDLITVLAERAHARRLRHLQMRLLRLDHQRNPVLADAPRAQRLEVVTPERAVPVDAAVDDATIERRPDLQGTGPVVRRDGELDRRVVRRPHVHEAAKPYGRVAAFGVSDPQPPLEDSGP